MLHGKSLEHFKHAMPTDTFFFPKGLHRHLVLTEEPSSYGAALCAKGKLC